MEINRILLQSNLDRMTKEFKDLQSLAGRHATSDSLKLSALVDRRLSQLELTRELLAAAGIPGGAVEPADLQHAYRRLKLELRFARRRWNRILSNEARFRKIQARKIHVQSFAA